MNFPRLAIILAVALVMAMILMYVISKVGQR